jgi:transcriptional regulator with XRE-family HTH domain
VETSTTGGLSALRLVMRLAGISQADLARRLGVSKQWVGDVLNGHARPSAAFRRDVPIVLSELLDIPDGDVGHLRVWFFGEPQSNGRAPGVLQRRLAEVS